MKLIKNNKYETKQTPKNNMVFKTYSNCTVESQIATVTI